MGAPWKPRLFFFLRAVSLLYNEKLCPLSVVQVRSYNGELRFRLRSSGGSRPFPAGILSSYPLVQLQGHSHLVLEHFPDRQSADRDGLHRVRWVELKTLKTSHTDPHPGHILPRGLNMDVVNL